MRRWLATLLAALAGAGCLVDDFQLGDERAAVVGGTVTAGDPAIAAVLPLDGDGNLISVCTGALIAPTAVLTAAHCLPHLDGAAQVEVFFGTSFAGDPIDRRFAVDWVGHPAWSMPLIRRGHDLAVVTLDAAPPLAPVPWARAPLGSLTDLPVRIVGFGQTAPGVLDGQKRTASTSIRFSDDTTFIAGTPASEGEVVQTCGGDSGGPNLIEIDGVETVIGVTSFGDPQCGFESGAARVDTDADFISSELPPGGGCDGLACDEPGDPADQGGGCSTAAPTGWPSALVLLLLVALGRSRRR